MAAALACAMASDRAAAQAADACGTIAGDGSVRCTAAGNPYRRGITYATSNDADGRPVDLTVVIDGDVTVRPGEARPIAAAVDLTGHLDAAVTLRAAEGSSVRTRGLHQAGVRVITEDGDIDIAAPAIVTRGDTSDGIHVRSAGGDISIQASLVRTSGTDSWGIFGRAADGDVFILAPDKVRTEGEQSVAIGASSPLGGIRIEATDVHTLGDRSEGLFATGQSVWASVTGTVRTEGARSSGAYLRAATGEAMLVLDGSIRTHGERSWGADLVGEAGAAIIGSGDVRADGDLAIGASAESANGDAVIDLARVVVNGGLSIGALAFSVNGDARVTLGDARAGGIYSTAASAMSGFGDASVVITGIARADGESSSAVTVIGNHALAEVQDALATGFDGSAILVRGHSAQVIVNGTAVARGGASANGYGATVFATGVADPDGARGDVLVTNNGRIVARGDNTAALLAQAAGSIAIDGAGRFATHGANSTAIRAEAQRDIAIDIGAVRTTGDGSIGIDAISGGAAHIAVGSVETSGAGSTGIRVQAGGDIDLRAGAIATAGDNASGAVLAARGESGVINASVGEVRTAGSRSHGISLVGGASLDATVVAGDIVTTGERSSGIHIVRNAGGEGDYDISAGSIVTAGELSDGITLITNDSGFATIRAGRLEVAGTNAGGIYVESPNLDLDIAVGSALASGPQSAGIYAQGANLTLETGGTIVSTGENGYGIVGMSWRDANLTIGGDVTATGDRSTAVGVRNFSPDSLTTVDMAGDIVTSGYFTTGFSAGGEGSVVARLNNVSNTGTPLSGFAILATMRGDIDLTVNDVTTHGYAINSTLMRSFEGNASLTVTGRYETLGAGGIFVLAEHGAAAVSVNDMDILSDGAPAVAVTALDSHLKIGGTINDRSVPFSTSHSTAIDLTAGSISFAGTAHVENMGSVNTFADYRKGIDIRASGTVALTGTGSVRTQGANAAAVTLTAGTDAADMWIQQREIATEDLLSRGASITGMGGDVTVDLGRVSTRGAMADGISISSRGQVTAAIGSIETSGASSMGLRVTTNGDIEAAVGSAVTTGNRAIGLWLIGGSVELQAGRVATAGDQAIGIRASMVGDLSLAVGELETRGAQAHGVQASAGGDAELLLGTVAATGSGADAVNLVATGSAAIEVGQGGGVHAANDAIALSTGVGAALVNRGTITADLGAAIRVTGGAATIWNGGGIDGTIVLTDAADSVTNAGTMRLTGARFGGGNDRLANDGELILAGDLDFGEGDDTLTNRGVLSLGVTAGIGLRSLAAGPVGQSITGLRSFTNSGLIDLRSGVAGDVLSIAGSFAGSGDSVIALDVRFGEAAAADRLTIAGAASGTTWIAINPLDHATAFSSGIVLVRAGAGTQAGAFRLEGAASTGFFAHGLAFDTGTGSFRLVTAPATGAYRLLKVGEGARSAWLDSSDTIAAHLAAEQGGGFWLAAGGNVNSRDQIRRFDSFGFAQDADLGYRQDAFTSQFGYGLERGALTLGVTLGYGNSALTFDGNADRVNYDALNGGIYAALHSGRFHANAIVKYDHYDIGVALPSIGEKAATGGSALGGRVEAGVRLGSARFHAEPRVSLSYQSIAIDPLALSAATRFDEWDGGRGTAGLRIASVQAMGATTLKIYAEADFVKALGDRAALTFTTGAVALSAEDSRFPDHGTGKLGFEVSGARASGFVEVTGRYAEGYRGGGARAGLRIAF